MGEYIKVYRFYDAPKELRELSDHGGDEDWLAVVPDSGKFSYVGWLQEGSSFGCCSVSEHRIEGATVYIGAHA